MPKPHTLKAIQKSLDDFALSNLRVARNRICLPADYGGLGLFNLDEFLTAQQCVWILRANESTRDNWRVDLRRNASGNCLNVGSTSFDAVHNPILHGLCKSFEKIRICHDTLNENYLNAYILHHPVIFRGRGDKKTLDLEYLEIPRGSVDGTNIAGITINDCFGQYGLISRMEFYQELGINLTLTGYANLGKAVTHYINRLTVNHLNNGTSVALEDEIRVKKPGKKIRELLSRRRKKPFDISKTQTCETFFRITDIEYTGNDSFSKNASLWTVTGLTNRVRSFIFKFYNNILGINTRTSHFAPNANRDCFFCVKKNPNTHNDETFIHLFYSCPVTNAWQMEFISKCFPDLTNLPARESKILWFLGMTDVHRSLFLTISILTFQYCVWEAKLKKRLPSFHSLFTEFLVLFRQSLKHNSEIRDTKHEINFILRRICLGERRDVHDGE
jgi:hypothetical protein